MKKIVVAGVGALGSHFVQIARNLKAEFKIIDFDRVEQQNTASQFHSKSTVGKTKVLGLQQTMQFLWGSKISGIPHKLTSENENQLLSGADLIVDCLDNGTARKIIQSFARASTTPCIHGALAANGAFGRIIWDEQFQIDEEPSGGAPTCEDGEHLPFIAMTSAFLAQAVQVYLTSGRKIGFQAFATGAMLI